MHGHGHTIRSGGRAACRATRSHSYAGSVWRQPGGKGGGLTKAVQTGDEPASANGNHLASLNRDLGRRQPGDGRRVRGPDGADHRGARVPGLVDAGLEQRGDQLVDLDQARDQVRQRRRIRFVLAAGQAEQRFDLTGPVVEEAVGVGG